MGPLGMMIAQAGTNAVLGIANNAMQMGQQKKLMALQDQYNSAATARNYDWQMKMWRDTNYSAQMEEIKKAGLNPALLYKNGGQGGSTNVATVSNNAPQADSKAFAPMDLAGIMQLKLLEAQEENIKADTKNKLANAQKTAGVDTEVAKSQLQLMAAQTDNEVIKKEINEQIRDQQFVETHIKQMTMNMVVSQAQSQTAQMWETLQQQVMQNKITRETADEQIAIIKQQKINLVLQKQVMEMGIEVNKAQIQKMAADIAQGWEGLSIQDKKARLEAIEVQQRTFYGGAVGKFMIMTPAQKESLIKQVDKIAEIGKEDFKK